VAIGEVGDKTGGDRPREHCIVVNFVKLLLFNFGKYLLIWNNLILEKIMF
jgi:hypothetical protein